MTAAATQVLEALGDRERPVLALVLGSGLGALVDRVAADVAIPYAELEGFPVSGVPGHAGRLVVGTLGSTRVAVLAGRAHLYEGVPAERLAVPVDTVAALGCTEIVLTNAAGSIQPGLLPGDLMLLTDHLNLMGANPLVGPHFVGLGDAYDVGLRERLHAAARATGVGLGEGVYLAVRGPSFETPAEIRAFRTLGADAVGMSTVPEVIAARHAGLRVAAISAITNLAEGLGEAPLTHEHTLEAAAGAAVGLTRLLEAFAA